MVITALVIGLFTGLHCLGMCGPIALSLGLDAKVKWKFISKNLVYQLGRITTYTFFGLLVGIIGEAFSFSGWQQYISIVSGILLLLAAFMPKNLTTSDKNVFGNLLMKLKLTLSKLLQKKDYNSLYSIGVLNGFLPCGAVYAALGASLNTTGIWQSAVFMFFFGFGTLPFMFMAVLSGSFIGLKVRTRLLKFFPWVLAILGMLFILRGLGLGIPFVSPDTNVLNLYNSHQMHHH